MTASKVERGRANSAFERLLNPRGVAVVGASENLNRIGGQPIKALVDAGYSGNILPVNPKYEEIAGLACYPSVDAIDKPCDVAVVAVPAGAVQGAIEGCGRAGIGFAIVLSGGFKETGHEGADRQEALVAKAREAGVRLIGPNCQGMVNFPDRVFAAFGSIAGELDLKTGNVSMAFQSGGFGFAIATLCAAEGVGFRTCVSTGNEADLTTPDLIEAFIDDPHTGVCGAYIEGVSDGRRLMEVGRKGLEAGKPILLWKGGNSESGARAAASHTANMTGRYEIYQAAFRQSGILEVGDVHEMGDLFKLFGSGRLPRGRSIGVLSISGGSGIVFADRAAKGGLSLPDFSRETADRLAGIVPAFGSAANPVDITAGVFNDITMFTRALEVVLEDPNIDQLALLLASIPGAAALAAARAIVEVAGKTDKPVLVGWSVQRTRATEAYELLEGAGVPIVPTPVRLAHAAALTASYAMHREDAIGRPLWPGDPGSDADAAIPFGSGALDERRSKQCIAAAGVPIARDVFVGLDEDPAAAADRLTYPLAAKIVSAGIAHKTEVGGVRLNIQDPEALRDVVADMIRTVSERAPGARLEGVLLTEMIDDGIEAIAGVVNDPSFGPVVAFGLGGILTEVLGDITYRVAPFDERTARDMIGELRGRALFEGVRGRPAADIDALCRALADLSRFAWRERERLAELDINPLRVREAGHGVVALDALVVYK
ncbi:MAG: CoA-binding protein [Proteobacteria bacterium]|nr:MAG: CoA-binding protein [Pseudomonadota bacterium]